MLAAAACQSPDAADDVYFPTHTFVDYGPAGELRNAVLVLDSSCLWLEPQEGEERFMALWPEGWNLRRAGDDLEVRTPSGAAAVVGQAITVGGGEMPEDYVAQLVTPPVPERCRGSKGWLVTGIL